MSREEYNWTEDPWSEEKQAEDAEELRHAKRMGRIAGVVVALLVVVAAVSIPVVTMLFVALAGAL